MVEKLKKIVVRLAINHPTGSRKRAGFTFTESPLEVMVDKSQLKMIIDDQYLRIITKGTALEQGKENAEKIKDKNIIEKSLIEGDIKEEVKGDVKLKTQNITEKDAIINQLIEKGLKNGEDFNSNANLEDLKLLLNN